MSSTLLTIGRLALYVPLTLVLIPVQFAALALDSRLAIRLPVIYHSLVCRIFGIDRVVSGSISTVRPTLFVSNHSSYLDIEVLGSIIEGSFVAKQDVAEWPFFGVLAKLQRTVFVERNRRHVGLHREAMAARFAAGDDLILFPEGTSNDGCRVLPFKSALFSLAEINRGNGPITVQPVSIAYTRLDGIPLGRHMRPFVAWFGDMDLAPHLWVLLGLGRLTVQVDFHAPVTIADFASRKEMADYCERVVGNGVTSAIFGRRRPEIPLRRAA
jgi:1-acyl-sn-glycerol-3-phosphate acyltransferase